VSTSQLSDQQLEANRLNAQKSTGPKSEAGRAASSANSRTHGLTGRVEPQTLEERIVYAEKAMRLIADWKPLGEQEEDFVQVILDASWQMSRAKSLEARLWRDLEAGVAHETAKLTIEKINRYSGHHTRIYFRAITELRKQQAVRHAAEAAKRQYDFQVITQQPYTRKDHGILWEPDGFVSSQSPYYQIFENLAKGTASQIAEKIAADSAAAAALPVAPAA